MFFSGIPSLFTVKIIIMTVITIMIIIMIMTVKILYRLMVVGAWLLTLVLASPQVNNRVQNVPKKVPNRNTCSCHSPGFEIIRKGRLFLFLFLFKEFFWNAPVKTIFSPGGDLEGLEAPKTRLLPSMILTMLRVWKWAKSKSLAI